MRYINDIPFTYFPGARDCLADLSEFQCNSDIRIQLFRVCHNLQSLTILFKPADVSNELKELISLQKNLKNLELSAFFGDYRKNKCKNWVDIIPALTKHPDTLTKLHLYSDGIFYHYHLFLYS